MIATAEGRAACAPPMPTLSDGERRQLADCERTIEAGLRQYHAVGLALEMVRRLKLYRESYGTFAAYVQRRWKFSDRQARNLIDAAEVADRLRAAGRNQNSCPNNGGTIGSALPGRPPVSAPENERQARALGRVPADVQAAVWERVLAETDGKPTSAAIQRVAGMALWKALTPEQRQQVVRADAAEREQLLRQLNASAQDREDGRRYRRYEREVGEYEGRGEGWADVAGRLRGVLAAIEPLVPEQAREADARRKKKAGADSRRRPKAG